MSPMRLVYAMLAVVALVCYAGLGAVTYEPTVLRNQAAGAAAPSFAAHLLLWPISASVTPLRRG